MQKTENFFVIHNYNNVPIELLDYCKQYIIYDASDDPITKSRLIGHNSISVRNFGHNITSYFRFFSDHYHNLPEYIALLKGNIIGRHLSREFFNRVYNRQIYTFLFEDRSLREKITKDVFFLTQENKYLEVNNSWYAGTDHPKKYFRNFNSLLNFIYQDPLIPEYCCFSPGACYIVSKYQVLKNSKEFYNNLHKVMSYIEGPKFPSEAHQIERMLDIIFTTACPVNNWMNDECAFDQQLIQHLETEKKEELVERATKSYHKIFVRKAFSMINRALKTYF